MRRWMIFGLLLFAPVARWAVAAEPDNSSDYQWKLPKGFPRPYVPADNPMSAAKVELGRYLFYDTRMSWTWLPGSRIGTLVVCPPPVA